MSPKVEEYIKIYKQFIDGPGGSGHDKLLEQGINLMYQMTHDEKIEATEWLLAQATHPREIADYTEALKLLKMMRDHQEQETEFLN